MTLAMPVVRFLALVALVGGNEASLQAELTLEPIDGPSQSHIRKSIRRGIHFLLKDQNRDGSWGSPHRTKSLNIYAPVPGAHHAFHAAVTSLCTSALIETETIAARPHSAWGKPGQRSQLSSRRVGPSIDSTVSWFESNLPKVKRAEPSALYNIWAHAYSIQALVRLHQRFEGDTAKQESLRALIQLQIDYLERYELVNGGWAYYDFKVRTQKPGGDSSSFTTATVLIALDEAKSLGIEMPDKIVKRAVASVRRQQKPDFTYLYGEYMKYYPMYRINRAGGSLGRSQVCNLAMRKWGDEKVTDEVIKDWLARLVLRNGWLSIGRKRPVPHESWFAVAGYFYYYGHYYAALCMDELPPDERAIYQAHIAKIIMDLQEKDGSWWDYPLYNYHQQYGTAFALMTLKRCLQVK